ncbi:MAG TPA: DUF4236 domain-containing protein [Candidatus Binatia bacterium]|nr:DUF4236 domain-containing protein [Candidatus Binatia bacterium]
MPLQFYRRVHLAPGLTVNLSRSGPSLSVGGRGAHVTVGRRGVTRTVGLPGTGVFYTSRAGWHSGVHTGLPVTPEAAGGSGIGTAVVVVLLAVLALAALIAFGR